MLLGVRSTREDDVGELGTAVTVMALVDDEGVLGDVCGSDLVGTEEPDDLRGGLGGLRARDGPAELVSTCAGSSALQNVVTVPLSGLEVALVLLDERTNGLVNGLGVGVLNSGGANNDHGSLSLRELLAELARESRLESVGIATKVLVIEGRVKVLTNNTDLEVGVHPLLPDPGVENGSFVSGVGADEKDGVGLFDTNDLGVEGVVGADIDTVCKRSGSLREVKSKVLRAETVGEVLGGNQLLGVDELTSNELDLVTLGGNLLELVANLDEDVLPGGGLELVVLPDQGSGETLCAETVAGESALVVYPLLVDIVVESGKNTHNLKTPDIGTNVAADTVQDVNGLSVVKFPRPGAESVGLGCEGTDGAKVDNVAGKLSVERSLKVGTDLEAVATAGAAKLRSTSNVVCETNATCAVNAAVHRGLQPVSQMSS